MAGLRSYICVCYTTHQHVCETALTAAAHCPSLLRDLLSTSALEDTFGKPAVSVSQSILMLFKLSMTCLTKECSSLSYLAKIVCNSACFCYRFQAKYNKILVITK